MPDHSLLVAGLTDIERINLFPELIGTDENGALDAGTAGTGTLRIIVKKALSSFYRFTSSASLLLVVVIGFQFDCPSTSLSRRVTPTPGCTRVALLFKPVYSVKPEDPTFGEELCDFGLIRSN